VYELDKRSWNSGFKDVLQWTLFVLLLVRDRSLASNHVTRYTISVGIRLTWFMFGR
jgi:hypothetical protein